MILDGEAFNYPDGCSYYTHRGLSPAWPGAGWVTTRYRMLLFSALALVAFAPMVLPPAVKFDVALAQQMPVRYDTAIMRGGPSSASKKQKKKERERGEKKTPPLQTRADPATAQREAHMKLVADAAEQHVPAIVNQLSARGFAIVDDFLPRETVLLLRREAEGLKAKGTMVPSESTRWDTATGSVQTYQKQNVLSTNLVGGDQYEVAPRLIEYCVALVSSLPPLVNSHFPEAALSRKIHTNKLAVCLGNGSQCRPDASLSSSLSSLPFTHQANLEFAVDCHS